jgi:uncharacterized glyoxalase superfamily protein PhnB
MLEDGVMMFAMSDAAKYGSVLIPSVRYKDAHKAIAWLERAFGFERHAVYDGPDGTVAHAELRFGTGMIMLGSASNPGPHTHLYATPEEIGGRVTSPLYLVVKDCTPVWESAKAAGAEVVMELKEMEYGGKAFSVRDPEGYLWSVGEYDPWAFASGVKA